MFWSPGLVSFRVAVLNRLLRFSRRLRNSFGFWISFPFPSTILFSLLVIRFQIRYFLLLGFRLLILHRFDNWVSFHRIVGDFARVCWIFGFGIGLRFILSGVFFFCLGLVMGSWGRISLI